MPGSKTNAMNRKEVQTAVRQLAPKQDYAWDGVDENERPATESEIKDALETYRKRGRPFGSDKTQIALRVDNDTLEAFRATGKGWQSRMNEALKDWLKSHSPGNA